jgi:Ran GTPase-activating protein (RanGAP) involved in mRNA processing and transport
VDLTNNLIGGEGGFAISLVLKENTRLKVLKLGMNKIDDMNASKIILSLGKNEYLEELDLSSNHLGDMVSNSLSYCFKNNKRLKILDLSYSQVFLDSDAKNLLEQHPCLIKLDLHSSKCSEGKLDLLKYSLDEVKSLESILIRKSVKQNLAYKKLNKN